jgi:hypothetical protein
MFFYGFCLLRVLGGVGMFWWVAGGVGVEATLAWWLLSGKVSCALCMGNLLVIGLLIPLVFDRKRFWQAMSQLSCFSLLHFYGFLGESDHVSLGS